MVRGSFGASTPCAQEFQPSLRPVTWTQFMFSLAPCSSFCCASKQSFGVAFFSDVFLKKLECLQRLLVNKSQFVQTHKSRQGNACRLRVVPSVWSCTNCSILICGRFEPLTGAKITTLKCDWDKWKDEDELTGGDVSIFLGSALGVFGRVAVEYAAARHRSLEFQCEDLMRGFRGCFFKRYQVLPSRLRTMEALLDNSIFQIAAWSTPKELRQFFNSRPDQRKKIGRSTEFSADQRRFFDDALIRQVFRNSYFLGPSQRFLRACQRSANNQNFRRYKYVGSETEGTGCQRDFFHTVGLNVCTCV